jgi:hypothetical protein
MLPACMADCSVTVVLSANKLGSDFKNRFFFYFNLKLCSFVIEKL